MTIYARPGVDYEAILEGAPSGLVGILTVAVLLPPATVIYGPSATGIQELVIGGDANTGAYTAQLTAPVSKDSYLIAWNDQSNPVYTEDLIVSEEIPVEITGTQNYIPTVDQVGALLRSRTKDRGGNELGTFTPNTRPADDDVVRLIRQAVGTLSTRAGNTVPAALIEQTQELAAIRAAMLIELGYFPEQVSANRSPYAQLKDMWVEGFGDVKNHGTLIQAITQENILGGEMQAEQPGLVRFNFPPPSWIGSRRL